MSGATAELAARRLSWRAELSLFVCLSGRVGAGPALSRILSTSIEYQIDIY